MIDRHAHPSFTVSCFLPKSSGTGNEADIIGCRRSQRQCLRFAQFRSRSSFHPLLLPPHGIPPAARCARRPAFRHLLHTARRFVKDRGLVAVIDRPERRTIRHSSLGQPFTFVQEPALYQRCGGISLSRTFTQRLIAPPPGSPARRWQSRRL